MSAWHKSGKGVRQAIGMILVRSQKPVILKAGELIHLTLDTFISVSFSCLEIIAKQSEASYFVCTSACFFFPTDESQRKESLR